MKLVALLLVASCTYDIRPAARGPRVECFSTGSTVYAGGYATNSGYGGCEQLPPDRCWGENSVYCRAWEEERLAHNRTEEARRARHYVGAGVAGVILAGVLLIAVASDN